jgi:HTH-type transcriptional regulator/antitoxin HigA
MMNVRPIRSKADHIAALREIDALWGAAEGTEDGDKLDVLLALVEHYEDLHYPIPASDPVGVIRYIMEENDYTQGDLANVLGSRSRASEILSGKRELTLDQIRQLNRQWRVPAGALIGELA